MFKVFKHCLWVQGPEFRLVRLRSNNRQTVGLKRFVMQSRLDRWFSHYVFSCCGTHRWNNDDQCRNACFGHWQRSVLCRASNRPLFMPKGKHCCLSYHFSDSKLILLPFCIETFQAVNANIAMWFLKPWQNSIFSQKVSSTSGGGGLRLQAPTRGFAPEPCWGHGHRPPFLPSHCKRPSAAYDVGTQWGYLELLEGVCPTLQKFNAVAESCLSAERAFEYQFVSYFSVINFSLRTF